MYKFRIYNNYKGWYLAHKKEILSGPWKTQSEAVEAKQEWLLT